MNARAASPLPPSSASSSASPAPSAQENTRPTDSNLPSDLATQAPPLEKQPAGDKDPGGTFSLLQRSSPVSPKAGASRRSRAHPPAWSRCRPLVATLRTPETAASSPAAPEASRQSHPEKACLHAPPQYVQYATAPPR